MLDTNILISFIKSKGLSRNIILPKLLAIADITRLEVYGNPGEEVRNRLNRFNAKNFHFFTGFIH